MQDQNKERRKRSIKLGIGFGIFVLLVYGISMYMIWMR
jgi:hypothetical protein